MPAAQPVHSSSFSLEDDFSAIYATWFNDVLKWVAASGVRGCDKHDVAQAVFVVVHRRLSDCDRRNVGGWLRRITVNQVRDYRRQVWNRAFFKRQELVLDMIPSREPSPVALLETHEARSVVDGALSGLPESTRATFLLFDLHGFTCAEIAALHRVVPNTVWGRLRRARRRVVAGLLEWRENERLAG
jgi:RNA polymerase sigma-70 factor (ECF subfamily)